LAISFAVSQLHVPVTGEIAFLLRKLVLFLLETKICFCLFDEPEEDQSVNSIDVSVQDGIQIHQDEISGLTLQQITPSPDFSPEGIANKFPGKLFFLPKFENILRVYLNHLSDYFNHSSSSSSFPSYDYACEIGGRNSQEDRITIIQDPFALYGVPPHSQLHFYSVYDGHRGCGAVDYSVALVPFLLFNSMRSSNSKATELLTYCYERTDEYFRDLALKRKLMSGTTATSVLFDGNRLFFANVGDSGAFLCRKSEPVLLYQKHTPENEDEKQRVKENGGIVVWWSGGWRVNGQYGVSRSIGDTKQKVIIATPFVSEIEITQDDEFFLIASDGLWDVMSEADVIEFIYCWQEDEERRKKRRELRAAANAESLEGANIEKKKKKKKRRKNLCQLLVDEALSLGSRDNVSIIVVFLKENERRRKEYFAEKPREKKKKEKNERSEKKKRKEKESSDEEEPDSDKEKRKKRKSMKNKDKVKKLS